MSGSNRLVTVYKTENPNNKMLTRKVLKKFLSRGRLYVGTPRCIPNEILPAYLDYHVMLFYENLFGLSEASEQNFYIQGCI